MKNEDISMFKFIQDTLGIKAFPYNWRPMQSGKFIQFFKVCKCGMLCVNFHPVAVYNSAVIEFWPLPLKQRIKLLKYEDLEISYKLYKRGGF